MMHSAWSSVLFTAALAAQAPTGVEKEAEAPRLDLTFGVYTTDKPTVMYRKFMPLVEATQEAMQRELKREVAIDFRIFKTYEEAREALVAGTIDFARFGPASYVLAKQANPDVALLAMETKNGKKTFQGHIVVREDSPIRSVAELRGKRFAFGDPTSTIGRYLAERELLAAGLHGADLAKFDYLGRHDRVFRAVELGDFDAGAVKSGTFAKLNEKQQLRVLASFDNVTKPWVARAALPDEVRSALAAGLIGMRDPQALAALKASSLVAASDEDYDVIRKSIAASRQFVKPRGVPAAPVGK